MAVAARWGAAAVVAVLAGVLAAGCSGGENEDGGDNGSVTGTPAMSASPDASATRATGPSPAPGVSATPTRGGTGPTPATPGTPAATATMTPEAVAEPTTTPAPSPTPVQPREHGDGTFTIVVSQGAAREAVRVEVAATPEERQRGLMFRQELAEDAGMLFLFGREVQTGFWMRNTYVPLDIAYIGADQRVIEVKQGKPLDESPLTPDGRYLYVLEVNAGWFERHGMGPGAVVALPDGLPPATDN
ncbi:MAG: DUF192 domain-containing protein [Dehalococcoidia bacterium]|nr:DUF192 domain-containing protein [Dehalococcoidia bacterium]